MDSQPAKRINIILGIISSLILMPLSPVLAESTLTLPSRHVTSYDVFKYDSKVGEMVSRLSQENGKARYESSTHATGLASMFVHDDLKELSTLEKDAEGTWHQALFNASRGKKHKDNQSFAFSSPAADQVIIKGSDRKGEYTLKLEPPVWGRHTLPLLMSSDLLQDSETREGHFQITDRGRLHEYVYTLNKNETIDIADKKLPVLKFKLIRKGSSRVSYVWLSKQHQYLPVKIEQYKDGDLNVSMLLTHYKTE